MRIDFFDDTSSLSLSLCLFAFFSLLHHTIFFLFLFFEKHLNILPQISTIFATNSKLGTLTFPLVHVHGKRQSYKKKRTLVLKPFPRFLCYVLFNHCFLIFYFLSLSLIYNNYQLSYFIQNC